MVFSKLKTAPTETPVTLAEAKAQLNIADGFTADNTIIESILSAATELFTNRTNRQLMQATWQLVLDAWRYDKRELLQLPVGPVVKIESISYYNNANALTTLNTSEYRLINYGDLAEIELHGNLPDLYDRMDAVIIEYVAGYGADGASASAQRSAINELDKRIIKVIATDMYQYRGNDVMGSMNEVSQTVDRLLESRKLHPRTFFEHA